MTSYITSEKQFQPSVSPLQDDIKSHVDALDGNKEFGLFCDAFPDRLIHDDQQVKTLSEYPGKSDPVLEIVYENDLSIRKSLVITKVHFSIIL